MSAPTRRHTDFSYRLPEPLELGVDDFTQTRITGVHQRWPSDPDTTERLRSLSFEDNRPSILKPLVTMFAIFVIVAGLYGLYEWFVN